MERLLSAYTRHPSARYQDYALKLLAVFAEHELSSSQDSATPSLLHTSASIEPLSERELEVLRLLPAGLSNQEISARLVVSPNTVKSLPAAGAGRNHPTRAPMR